MFTEANIADERTVFTFLDMAGNTLFVRDDAERAQWTQEEMSLEMDFPYVPEKVVDIGQRVFFHDPSTGEQQIYEIKEARTTEPDHYQKISAEHIIISELTDEHMDKTDLDNERLADAMATVLSGTLWEMGEMYGNPKSSVSLSRGSVWQAVLDIKENYNVFFEPHVELRSNGTIRRYINVIPPVGQFRGVRLSVDKNMSDPCVIFNDSELVTALYGYGGTITATSSSETNVDVTFKDVVWEKTSTHPAKPAGQKYIEKPDATQKYGRNGRPRFGYYQNTDITDAETLLKKTWETLQTVSEPQISIEGTIQDLYRLGYADQPLRLWDTAIVEVLPVGFKQEILISKMTTDLLDPSSTTVTLGAYIPNIIYICNETSTSTTGSSAGGTNKNKEETTRSEFETKIEANNNQIQLRAYQNDLDDLDNALKLQEARITVEHNRITQEVTDRRNADNTLSSRITQTASQIRAEVTETANSLQASITIESGRITQEITDRRNADNTLSSRITQTATQIRAEVTESANSLNAAITIESGRITQEITDRSNADNTLSSTITQTANSIRAEVSETANSLQASIDIHSDQISLVVTGTGNNKKVVAASIVAGINAQSGSYVTIQANKIDLDGYVTTSMLSAAFQSVGQMTVSQVLTVSGNIYMNGSVYVDGNKATWKSYSARWCGLTGEHTFKDVNGNSYNSRLVNSYTDTTIYYLGR